MFIYFTIKKINSLWEDFDPSNLLKDTAAKKGCFRAIKKKTPTETALFAEVSVNQLMLNNEK